tara:strand:- start:1335 stop:1538 length:204 start_codon:yes stop_codon:yes gene_type:complete
MNDEYTEAMKKANEKATVTDEANDAAVKSKTTEEQAIMLKKKKGEITQAEMDEKMAKIAAMMKNKGK